MKSQYEKLKFVLFPIQAHEMVKFLPMAIMTFFILLNQNLVRGLKDSIVVTMIGSEAISFIKLWGEMPIGILFVIVYSKLCNKMTTEQVFRVILIGFLSFFMIFAFVIFPYTHYFHPNPKLVADYIALMPHMKWFIILWGQWSYVIFYIMGELWPIVVFSLLFWQLANKITTTEESKRFYLLFSFFGQTNLLISGFIMKYLTRDQHCFRCLFNENIDQTQVILKSFMIVVLLSGIVIFVLHKFIENKIVNNALKNTINNVCNIKPNQVLKLNLKESTKMIFSSKYLGFICLLMISYSSTISLIEGVWMSKTRQLYPITKDFLSYQAEVLFWTGIFTLFMSIFGSVIIRKFGWFIGAMSTPFVILIVGALFFTSVVFQQYLELLSGVIYFIKPLSLIVLIGGFQNVLCKGVKYTLFDTTKEMVYIPLSDEMKTKGKAAVDVVGAKIGKSVGAVIQCISFTMLPNACHDDIAGFLMILFLVFCFVWLYAVKALKSEYETFNTKSHF